MSNCESSAFSFGENYPENYPGTTQKHLGKRGVKQEINLAKCLK
jgi:hypothetical protein